MWDYFQKNETKIFSDMLFILAWRPALELEIAIPGHMMVPSSKVLIQVQDG